MKIAICGSAPSSSALAPFRDASYEQWSNKTQRFPTPDFAGEEWIIYGCSPGFWGIAERVDVWWELHRWEPGKPWFSPEYVTFLQTFRGKVMTGGPVPEIKNHVVYPIERVEQEFSAYFLHSSIALMAAFAILEIEDDRKANPGTDRNDVIGFWGVDMAANDEYAEQKVGCHFFILEAMRRGISVYVPPESCILRPKPVYGISEWDHNYIKATARARELNARRAQAEQQIQATAKQADFLSGAIDNHNYWINTWTSPYGIPSGLVINHEPGTGLGGGITLNRPYSPPPDSVIDAVPPQPDDTIASKSETIQPKVETKPKKAGTKRRK